jgi:hypothetical protein
MDKAKVEIIKEWPTSKTVSDVRSFHGLTSFYRRFVKYFSTITTLLTEIVKIIYFKRKIEQEKAFNLLKEKLILTPLLVLPNYTKTFKIKYYVSVIGISAALIHDKRLMVYFREKLNGVSLNYSRYDKMLYVLVRTLGTLQHYFWLKKFEIHINHQYLKKSM